MKIFNTRALLMQAYQNSKYLHVMTDEERYKLQTHLRQIYLDIERVCQKHGLQMMVAYGTVLGALRHKGYDVRLGVGSSTSRIDVAVVDPVHPNRYLLGIVCDGEGYFSMKTARDREVVQPTMLHMLGWRLVHVWAGDWLLWPDTVVNDIIEDLKNDTSIV